MGLLGFCLRLSDVPSAAVERDFSGLCSIFLTADERG